MKRLFLTAFLSVLYSTHVVAMDKAARPLIYPEYKTQEIEDIVYGFVRKKAEAIRSIVHELDIGSVPNSAIDMIINAYHKGLSQPKAQTVQVGEYGSAVESPMATECKNILQQCGIHPTHVKLLFANNNHYIRRVDFNNLIPIMLATKNVDELTYECILVMPQAATPEQLRVHTLQGAMFICNTAITNVVKAVLYAGAPLHNRSVGIGKSVALFLAEHNLRDVVNMQNWLIPALCSDTWRAELLQYLKVQKDQYNGTISLGTQQIAFENLPSINETTFPSYACWQEWHDMLERIDTIYKKLPSEQDGISTHIIQ